jgi:hypothetical protein
MGDPALPQALLYTAWKRRAVPGLAEVGDVHAVSWEQSCGGLRILL